DELFTHMVKTYTEIQTHIKVSIETGTVERGALWTEEYVPSEAVFYFMVDGDYTISEKTFQIGGNTTSGKGIVEVVEL
ncbi:MAG: RAMP superfamily CRISPR-associated protein, partial [Hydrogenobacter sp.]